VQKWKDDITEGRPARPAGRARVLNGRPDQPRHRPRHLYQAPRRGQGGSRHLRLRHQPHPRPLMPICHGTQADHHGHVRPAKQREYQYPNYFQIQPRARPSDEHGQRLLELAAGRARSRRRWPWWAPKCVPAERAGGRAELGEEVRLQNVYDKTYPPSTVDYTPIVRAIKATNPDVVFVASYPPTRGHAPCRP